MNLLQKFQKVVLLPEHDHMYEDAFRMQIEGSIGDQTIHNGDLPGHGSNVKMSELWLRLC